MVSTQQRQPGAASPHVEATLLPLLPREDGAVVGCVEEGHLDTELGHTMSAPLGIAGPTMHHFRRRHLAFACTSMLLLAGTALLRNRVTAARSGSGHTGSPYSSEAGGDFVGLQGGGETVKIVRSTMNSAERLTWKPELSLGPDFDFTGTVVDIHLESVDQEILGFGGAFTESAAVTFSKLEPRLQDALIDQYFGTSGLGYTLGRVHINSCDFSVESYSFDDTSGDLGLQHFDHALSHDKRALIPLIVRARRKVEESSSGSIVQAPGDTASQFEFERFTFVDGIDGPGTVALRSSSGQYVGVTAGGALQAVTSEALPSAVFRVEILEDGSIALRSSSGKYIAAGADGTVHALGGKVTPDSKFVKTGAPQGTFTLKTQHGTFLSTEPSKLRMLASPWSPPAWMKTNGQMASSKQPCLKPEVHGAWAEYISTWISDAVSAGIPVWGLTVQNEPSNPAGWEACTMTPQEEADFVGKFLGPTIKRQHPEVSIFVFDDSKHMLTDYVNAAMHSAEVAKYVDGAAFHWYSGDFFDRVGEVHRQNPRMMLLSSEATYERRMWQNGMVETYSDWRFGEGYAHDIIGDLNNGASGWIDWNLLLEKAGGPNHVGNVCDAAVVADLKEQTLEVHPQYYYIGHFSKFIVSGSRHLLTTITGSRDQYAAGSPDGPYGTCTGAHGLESTAARRPDGDLVVVVLNCAQEEIEFKLRVGARAFKTIAPKRSITTFLLPAGIA